MNSWENQQNEFCFVGFNWFCLGPNSKATRGTTGLKVWRLCFLQVDAAQLGSFMGEDLPGEGGVLIFHLAKNMLLFSPVGFKGNLSLLEICYFSGRKRKWRLWTAFFLVLLEGSLCNQLCKKSPLLFAWPLVVGEDSFGVLVFGLLFERTLFVFCVVLVRRIFGIVLLLASKGNLRAWLMMDTSCPKNEREPSVDCVSIGSPKGNTTVCLFAITTLHVKDRTIVVNH